MSKIRKDGGYDERYKGGRTKNMQELNSVIVFILYVVFIPLSIFQFYIIPMPFNYIVGGFLLLSPITQTNWWERRKLEKFTKSLKSLEDLYDEI